MHIFLNSIPCAGDTKVIRTYCSYADMCIMLLNVSELSDLPGKLRNRGIMNKISVEETLHGYTGRIHCETCNVTILVSKKTEYSAMRSVEAIYDKHHTICASERDKEIPQQTLEEEVEELLEGFEQI